MRVTALSPSGRKIQGAHKLIEVGQPAPDFTLTDHNRRLVSLDRYRDIQNVVLSFFVFAFTDN
jgi:peroxiredoxin